MLLSQPFRLVERLVLPGSSRAGQQSLQIGSFRKDPRTDSPSLAADFWLLNGPCATREPTSERAMLSMDAAKLLEN